uniref:RING-type E3 ubiquitin transferase n=1 Tax=Manihot esculenta TaxID=3983 RepID=A0A2C9UHF2_MANES
MKGKFLSNSWIHYKCYLRCFFSIYFCRCFMESVVNNWHLRRSPSGNNVNPSSSPANNGLDPSLIQIFPTFTYSSVKDFRREKYGLECAVCLAEFEDNDMLRLLTVCYHVFHQECIDLWLESHKTCPVCRGDLDLPRETLEKTPILEQNNDHHQTNNNSLVENSISIDIAEDDDGDEEGRSRGGNGKGIMINDDENKQNQCHEKIERFSRSHSTGHSIVVAREEEDKYTLRLIDNVQVKILRGHNTSESCIALGDFSSPRNG